MGRRGPRPLPTKILELRGSPRARLRAGEPEPPTGIPPCPEWVSERGRAHWERVVELLKPYGVLTLQDGEALGLLVDAIAQYEDSKEDLRKTKKPKAKLSWQRIVNANRSMVLKILREFGLSPSSRCGVKGTGGSTPEEKDPLSLFNQKKQSG